MPHFFEFIHLRDRRDLPHLGLVILLITGIMVGVYLSLQPQIFNKQAAEGGLVEVKFIPEILDIQKGQTYEAKIEVNPKAERVTAVQLSISYDPEVVSIIEIKNDGFLPIDLKTEDNKDGVLTLIYGGTVDTQATLPGTLATLKFKALSSSPSSITIKSNSQVSVSSKEGNVLTAFSKLSLMEHSGATQTISPGDIKYPDNLLEEKVFFPDSSPFVRDFKEAIEPKPEIKPERIKPQLSEKYILQLGRDIFIDPVVSLNEVLRDKVGEIIKPGE